MAPHDPQDMRYTEEVLETRPGLVGICSLAVDVQGYSILWSDASGFVSFPILQSTKEEPHWTVMCPKKTYGIYHQFYTGECCGRKTAVSMDNNPGSASDFAVIRDTYRNDGQLYEEAVLSRHGHSDGLFPGIVRVLSSGLMTGQDGSPITTICTAASGIPHREKRRLVIRSRGSKLENVRSAKDILMAMLDGVEGIHSLSNIFDVVCC